MSQQNTLPLGGAPNQIVADNATKPDTLPMAEVALLGVAGPEGDMKALIRLSDGTILRAGLGERMSLGRLTEISPAGVVLELANGNASFLRPFPYHA